MCYGPDDKGWLLLFATLLIVGALIGAVTLKGCEYVGKRVHVEWGLNEHERIPEPR